MQKAGHTKRWSQQIRAPPFHVWIGKEEGYGLSKSKGETEMGQMEKQGGTEHA